MIFMTVLDKLIANWFFNLRLIANLPKIVSFVDLFG